MGYYDLTSFSLCEHMKCFDTKDLKYHSKGQWYGFFPFTFWSFLWSTVCSFILIPQFLED